MQFCLSVYKCVCVSALHTFPTLKCQSGCHQANLSPRKAGKKKKRVFSEKLWLWLDPSCSSFSRMKKTNRKA